MRHEGFWSKTTWAFPDQSCCRPNAREGHVDLHFTVSIGHVEMSNAKVRRTKAEIYSATPLQSSMLRRHQRKTSLRLGSAIRVRYLFEQEKVLGTYLGVWVISSFPILPFRYLIPFSDPCAAFHLAKKELAE